MFRRNFGLIAAALGALVGIGGGPGGAMDVTGAKAQLRASASPDNVDPSRPVPAAKTSNAAKVRDLSFYRGGSRRPRRYLAGVKMTCAEGKRRARKVRNRQRHKKQWKKAVR